MFVSESHVLKKIANGIFGKEPGYGGDCHFRAGSVITNIARQDISGLDDFDIRMEILSSPMSGDIYQTDIVVNDQPVVHKKDSSLRNKIEEYDRYAVIDVIPLIKAVNCICQHGIDIFFDTFNDYLISWKRDQYDSHLAKGMNIGATPYPIEKRMIALGLLEQNEEGRHSLTDQGVAAGLYANLFYSNYSYRNQKDFAKTVCFIKDCEEEISPGYQMHNFIADNILSVSSNIETCREIVNIFDSDYEFSSPAI